MKLLLNQAKAIVIINMKGTWIGTKTNHINLDGMMVYQSWLINQITIK